jgi:hypothetical protein
MRFASARDLGPTNAQVTDRPKALHVKLRVLCYSMDAYAPAAAFAFSSLSAINLLLNSMAL